MAGKRICDLRGPSSTSSKSGLRITSHTSDITFDYTHGTNEMIVHNKHAEPWRVTVVDTGLNTQTGGRVKRIREYIGNEPFMLTYGDAVGDVNIAELVAFHQAHGKIGTMSMYNFGKKGTWCGSRCE